MVSSNKVLTVSYGTFSCTLEGFEDSFDTMKAIAEYFRDLAADDRYFGAEPPQPDAYMLARIAQREIARQVEARQEGTGIVLRASDASAAPVAATAAVVAPATAALDDVDAADTADTADTAKVASPAAPVADEPADEPVDHSPDVAVSIAEASEDEDKAPNEDQDTAKGAPEEDAIAEPEDAIIIEDAVTVEAEATPATEDIKTEDSSSSASAGSESEPESVEAEILETPDDVSPAPEVQAEPSVDSIAAKLQRIRDVVARNEATADADEYTEDLQAEAFVDSEAAAITDVLTAEDEAVEADDDDAIGAVLGQLDRADQNEESDADASLFTDLETDARPDPEVRSAVDEPISNIAAEEPRTEAPAPTRKIRRVRVKKVKRADLEQAISTGAIEEIDEAAAPKVAIKTAEPDPESSLSPEDEADLMRELAAVEAEFSTTVDAAAPAPEAEPEAEPAPRTARLIAEDQDEDLSRLMAAAQEKLGDPETTSKAEAYQNLRAAVAATQADRETGGDAGTEARDDAYRADLAEAVKPRRPIASGSGSTRPRTTAKPAPLKLVAEQRVDEAVEVAPVRPRRVSAQVETTEEQENADEFATFIEEMDVHSLTELLEATAAYMSFAEGRDQFSRPQLMNKVRLVHDGEFNREDGLRAFGQLLREGKIEKAGGGRFSASGEIGFQPEARAAG